MSDMEFRIGQNDSLPNIYTTLSAEFDSGIPESEHVVYNNGDTIKLYLVKSTGVVARTCEVEESINGGKEVLVKASLDPEDVARGGVSFGCYFRNETIGLSFPTSGFGKIYIEEKGHSPSE